MATTGHCAYCFEILVADLENREPLAYRKVQDLWKQYHSLSKAGEQDEETEGDDEEVSDPDLQDGDDLVEDSEMDDLDDQDDPDAEEEYEAHLAASRDKPPTLQLPSISRLQAPSPGTPSSSSSSTPSSLSTPASSVQSKSSSATSFFSFSRSKQPSPLKVESEEYHPLFITWNLISRRSGHKSLRGCIGTFDAQELANGLRSYALTAAFDDQRFPPIARSELSTLSCSTTLLTNFTPCAFPLDWTLGTHGIRIAFASGGKRYNATYLPDVATEQGWSKEETLTSLMRKSGWRPKGRETGWRDVKGGVDVVRYEGRKATLGWEEWRSWRAWVQGLGVR